MPQNDLYEIPAAPSFEDEEVDNSDIVDIYTDGSNPHSIGYGEDIDLFSDSSHAPVEVKGKETNRDLTSHFPGSDSKRARIDEMKEKNKGEMDKMQESVNALYAMIQNQGSFVSDTLDRVEGKQKPEQKSEQKPGQKPEQKPKTKGKMDKVQESVDTLHDTIQDQCNFVSDTLDRIEGKPKPEPKTEPKPRVDQKAATEVSRQQQVTSRVQRQEVKQQQENLTPQAPNPIQPSVPQQRVQTTQQRTQAQQPEQVHQQRNQVPQQSTKRPIQKKNSFNENLSDEIEDDISPEVKQTIRPKYKPQPEQLPEDRRYQKQYIEEDYYDEDEYDNEEEEYDYEEYRRQQRLARKREEERRSKEYLAKRAPKSKDPQGNITKKPVQKKKEVHVKPKYISVKDFRRQMHALDTFGADEYVEYYADLDSDDPIEIFRVDKLNGETMSYIGHSGGKKYKRSVSRLIKDLEEGKVKLGETSIRYLWYIGMFKFFSKRRPSTAAAVKQASGSLFSRIADGMRGFFSRLFG